MTQDENQISDENQIGAFAGYIRRPKPTESGMVAQFFGENGSDADTICALSLTKFQDANVHVEVHVVKDPNGVPVRGENGEHPLVASFAALSRRPVPQKEGMMAQFFAANGHDADQVVDLGKSGMQDAFVFVQIFKSKAGVRGAFRPELNAALAKVAERKTVAERKELRNFAKSWEISARKLEMSGFLRSSTVQSALGRDEDYLSWLSDAPCCAPGDAPCSGRSTAFRLDSPNSKRFAYVPLCAEHSAVAVRDGFPGGRQFLSMKQALLVQRWAWDQLCSVVGLEDGVKHPDPAKIWAWAAKHNIQSLLPNDFLNGRN